MSPNVRAQGIAREWDGGAVIDEWFEPENWNPNGIPDATDLLELSSGDVVVTTATVDINNRGRISIQDGADLQLGTTRIGLVGDGGLVLENADLQTRMVHIGDPALLSRGQAVVRNSDWHIGPASALLARNGNLEISNASSVVVTNQVWIGDSENGNAIMDVSHVGTTLTAAQVSAFPRGTINVDHGAVINSQTAGINGKANVSSAGTWNSAGSFTIGRNNSGTLQLRSGGLVTSESVSLGFSTGRGSIYVDDAGSLLDVAESLVIGEGGYGNLHLSNGGRVQSETADIAASTPNNGSSGKGSVTVRGIGSFWDNNALVNVGLTGDGALLIAEGGTVESAGGELGVEVDSSGIVIIQGLGSSWTNEAGLVVGRGGTGTLNVGGGAAVSSTDGTLGQSATGSGSVTVSGGGTTWDAGTDLRVGILGNGDLTIKGGARVQSANAKIGTNAGGSGKVTLSDTGSAWSISDTLNVGEDGAATLTIGAGATVTTDATVLGQNGALYLEGGTLHTTSFDARLGTLQHHGGVLNVTSFQGNGVTVLGGTFNLYGASEWSSLVLDGSASGTLHVLDGATAMISDFLRVGASGKGAVVVQNGTLTNSSATIGDQTTGNGTVTVDGESSSWRSTSFLHVGDAGTATLNISGGASVSNSVVSVIGREANGFGRVNVTGLGSHWTMDAPLDIGRSGEGILRIHDGASVTTTSTRVAVSEPISGVVSIDGHGSIFRIVDDSAEALRAGVQGDASLAVTNGGRLDVAGGVMVAQQASSTSTLSVSGSHSSLLVGLDLQLGEGTDGGAANLIVGSDAIVRIGGTTSLGGRSQLTINGGTLVTQSLDNSGAGAFRFVRGVLTIDDGFFNPGVDNFQINGTAGDAATLNLSGEGKRSKLRGVTRVGNRDRAILNVTAGYRLETTDLNIGERGVVRVNHGTLAATNLTNTAGGKLHLEEGTLLLEGGTLDNGETLLLPVGATLMGSGNVVSAIRGQLGSTITASQGSLTLGNASFNGFVHEGTLNVGAEEVTLSTLAFAPAQLGAMTSIDGGTLSAANGVALGSGDVLRGTGTIAAEIAAAAGSFILMGGSADLGDASSLHGFVSEGTLVVGNESTVRLHDANQAQLGALTRLGLAGELAATLEAANGVVLAHGRGIVGSGTLDTPNQASRPTMINGTVQGTGGPITLTGFVKGIGNFENVLFAGTHSPGLSTTTLHVGDLSYAESANLQIEIGGLTPGTEYDQVISDGALTLGGTLEVILLDGVETSLTPNDQFTVITTANGITGQWSNVNNGQRLAVKDNHGSFLVEYGLEGAQSNNLVLSDFRPISVQSISWLGGNDNWQTTSQWSTGQVPNNREDQVFDVIKDTNGTVTLDEAVAVQNLTLARGTVTGSGNLAVNHLNWTAGTLSGTGRLTTTNGGTIGSSGSLNLSRPLINRGLLDIGPVILFGNGTGSIHNEGTLVATNGGRIRRTGPSIVNDGTLRVVTGGTNNETFLHERPLTNNGLVEVQTGSLTLAGGGVIRGRVFVADSAQLNLSSPTDRPLSILSDITGPGETVLERHTTFFESDSMVTDLVLSAGSMGGRGHVRVTNLSLEGGGSLQGSGSTTVTGTADIWQVNALNRELSIEGTLNWHADRLFGNGTLRIRPNGVAKLIGQGGSSGGAADNTHLINDGMIVVEGTAEAPPDFHFENEFMNDGLVDVREGRLKISGLGSTNAGQILIANGALLELSRTTSTGSIRAEGEVLFSGTSTVAGPYNAKITTVSRDTTFNSPTASTATLKLTGGTVAGNGQITAETLDWTAGNLTGTVVATDRGTINMTSARFEGGHLVNQGIIGWQRGRLGAGGVITNQSGAELQITGVEDREAPSVTNLGTVTKSDDAVLRITDTYDNRGRTVVESGVLNITGVTVQHDGARLADGEWEVSNRGVLQLNRSGARDVITNQAEVILRGPDSLFPRFDALADNQGYFEITAGRSFDTLGDLASSGQIVVGDGSTLTVNGVYTQSGEGVLQVDGEFATSRDPIVLENGAVLSGSGLVSAQVVIGDGGIVSPGATIGTLSVENITLDSGTYVWELDDTDRSDQITVSQSITLGTTANLQLVDLGGVPDPKTDYVLFHLPGDKRGSDESRVGFRYHACTHLRSQPGNRHCRWRRQPRDPQRNRACG